MQCDKHLWYKNKSDSSQKNPQNRSLNPLQSKSLIYCFTILPWKHHFQIKIKRIKDIECKQILLSAVYGSQVECRHLQ